MNSTTDARGALRDLFQFHYTSQAWLPAVFVLVTVGALAVLLGEILYVRPGRDYVPPDFQLSIAIWAIVAGWSQFSAPTRAVSSWVGSMCLGLEASS